MNRRLFLHSLGIGLSALALDPERLLWIPRAKKIFIPAIPFRNLATITRFKKGDSITFVCDVKPVANRTLPAVLRRFVVMAEVESLTGLALPPALAGVGVPPVAAHYPPSTPLCLPA